MDDAFEISMPAGTLVVRPPAPDDEPAVQRVFTASADWFEAASGMPPADAEVQSLYYSLPEGADFTDKRLLVIADGDRVLGIVDFVLHHPAKQDCSVGMFLIEPDARRYGIGTFPDPPRLRVHHRPANPPRRGQPHGRPPRTPHRLRPTTPAGVISPHR